MSAFYFGPLGAMRPLVVSAGVQVETARAQSEFVSAGGVRWVQRGRSAPRTWTVGRLHQGPEWARMLSAAAHGLLPQCWLYDVAQARENMVPAPMSSGPEAAVSVDGLPMGGLINGHTVQLPVLAGRLYTVSAWADYPSNTRVATIQINADPVMPVGTPTGTGTRYCAASFVPAADSVVTLRTTRVGVSGLRMHDGPPDGAFMTGYGTPCRVAVQDPARTLQLVTGQVRSDYEVTLQEVGKPGFV